MIQHNFDRLHEWAAASVMLSFAAILGLDPKSLGIGALRLITDTGITSPIISSGLSLLAVLRILALFNESARLSPWVRGGVSAIMFLFWLQVLYALFRFPIVGGFIPLMTAFIVGQIIGDFVSVMRAVQDGRR